ncbi:16S rRNA (guanine(527)-N(7))-methyltransferase RsmG [Sphingomonas xanthus]|uniref:Ribosomal RNA small subunit methyltransferase G n=1 Tax=Sphingomonas xanthus TaxID=2594473 RepID=A0A516IRV4_9SPHN|nr:16S rRNA (guanine(527)-N(7))-methyltransferase RsmG [Sphingomonas xanthus]QDP19544.1 16S rRNA (guanine(527)-N(7))-methyltransferase RsmG [Sphingomonas xanthus]
MIDLLAEAARRPVSRETMSKLQQFSSLLLDANARQNLISPSSVNELWTRHIMDGAQLAGLVTRSGTWCDVGSGAGLPGLVIAILTAEPMTLIEPRKLRAQFLREMVGGLGLNQVRVAEAKVERVTGMFDFITARAVAPLPKLFGMARHLAHTETEWILPKGRKAKTELDEAQATWQGSFRLVPSRTSEDSAIVIACNVRRRGNR